MTCTVVIKEGPATEIGTGKAGASTAARNRDASS
jgi:hypothetical protein